ncbi:MAG: hypothetical protein DMF87_08740 [Acidobacteria bacterium]|nr:MAG: hypothetical protein DMF87_08740 [Acidobacteriota bacterium]
MAKKRKVAQRFKVEATLHNVELVRAGSSVRLQVFRRGEKLGDLQIGRGSIFWWGAKRKNRKRLRWDTVADQFNRLAYPKEFK